MSNNGCSTIGISKSAPVEITEQVFPVLFRKYALHEGSGGAGRQRGGFGLSYEVELLRGDARASFAMDHGRFGPQGALGGSDGGTGSIEVIRDGVVHRPEHITKEQDLPLKAGNRVRVDTPGGGGYGPAFERDPQAVRKDVLLGYFTCEQAARLFGVALREDMSLDEAGTQRLRSRMMHAV
ncbi:N-methylhydantoinase A/acetone carboxylase, beta subunit [Martelella mediterranea DSM 17316]|uniref:N-methylhydantoinase A/acetone carboxylase, beta subunit n=1 Tax=Martelella mediterranea DSM 17316 TaxID=1122214 RepID=A0A1U9YWK8_9HYPH|nr:N-methylhydantoinase A/acetone carboxylase, beta subunit [Martelella mediterranea DSM 17316]